MYLNTDKEFRDKHLQSCLQLYYDQFSSYFDDNLTYSHQEFLQDFHRFKAIGFTTACSVMPNILSDNKVDIQGNPITAFAELQRKQVSHWLITRASLSYLLRPSYFRRRKWTMLTVRVGKRSNVALSIWYAKWPLMESSKYLCLLFKRAAFILAGPFEIFSKHTYLFLLPNVLRYLSCC